MATEIEDQLATYFRWLEAHTGLSLHRDDQTLGVQTVPVESVPEITALEMQLRAASEEDRAERSSVSFDTTSGDGRQPLDSAKEIYVTLEPSTKGRRNGRLLAVVAGLVAISVAGLAFLVNSRNDDGSDTGTEVPDAPTPSATIAPTTTTIAPTTTTIAPTTTTIPPLSDAELASAILLPPGDFAPGWVINKELPTARATDLLRANVASTVEACAPFVVPVFEAAEQATVANRYFYHPAPNGELYGPTAALFSQYVVVFSDEESATAMVDAVSDPGFAECASDYGAVASSAPEGFFDLGLDQSPFSALGDQMTFSVYEQSWTDPQGVVHGPEENFGSVVRVGRTVTFTGALHMGDAGVYGNVDDNVEVVSIDQFEQQLTNVVNRAQAALQGTPLP